MTDYKKYINVVADFPKNGIFFKDISPLLADDEIFKGAIGDMGRLVKNPDYWIGIDARGFIFASALSIIYGGGVILCRKKGKLPPPVQTYEYNISESQFGFRKGRSTSDAIFILKNVIQKHSGPLVLVCWFLSILRRRMIIFQESFFFGFSNLELGLRF